MKKTRNNLTQQDKISVFLMVLLIILTIGMVAVILF